MREAEVLDPRSVETAPFTRLAAAHRRRYAEALPTAERARALAPSNLWAIVAVSRVHLAQGDLAGARSVLRAVPAMWTPPRLWHTSPLADLTGCWTMRSSGCFSGSRPRRLAATGLRGASRSPKPTRCEGHSAGASLRRLRPRRS